MFDAEAAGAKVRQGLSTFPADLGALSDGAVEAGFAELQLVTQALEAKRLAWLAEVERRRAYAADGYLSAAAWLADRFGVAAGEANHEVRIAAALGEMPGVGDALAAGRVSSSAVRILMSARESNAEAFARDEDALPQEATARGADELRRVVSEWAATRDDRPVERAERLRERRRVDACPTADGMMRISGELDPESGDAVVSALRAVIDAELRSSRALDHRTPGQRRADALAQLAYRYLDSSDRPSVSGERPHVTVTVGIDALREKSGSGELDQGGTIHAEAARRLACDARLTRMILGPRSEPLDVGRRTSVVPSALRMAVAMRDRRCRFPGCGRPHAWCDAHHVVHWANGGETRLPNLVLLCRPHHRLVHEGGFGLRMVDGTPVFSRPDGTMLAAVLEEDRAPP